jgi:hypothetical protein
MLFLRIEKPLGDVDLKAIAGVRVLDGSSNRL